MQIQQITSNKKHYLDLLLTADENEEMFDRYLAGGDMFALADGCIVKTVCVVASIDKDACELKNIATYEEFQGRGYAKAMIEFISDYYKSTYRTMLVGTGDVPWILAFYESCGFEPSHRIANFFTDNYDHPMYDSGVQLVDMVYLKKNL